MLTSELLERLDAGDVTAHELLSAVRTQLGWQCNSDDFAAAWSAAFQPDLEVIALARRTVVPSALLTNNGPPLSDAYCELVPLVATAVPRTLFSAHTGFTKPDSRAFLNACRVFGAAPSDVLLIDDSSANTDSAATAGLRAHRYQSAVVLENRLGPRASARLPLKEGLVVR